MAKYTVQKTTSHTMKMVIEAENEKEALHIARSEDFDYNGIEIDYNVEYEIEEIEEIE